MLWGLLEVTGNLNPDVNIVYAVGLAVELDCESVKYIRSRTELRLLFICTKTLKILTEDHRKF